MRARAAIQLRQRPLLTPMAFMISACQKKKKEKTDKKLLVS
jgi:hypothetical protein